MQFSDGNIKSGRGFVVVKVLPSMVGQAGKFLATDGNSYLWETIAGGGDMTKSTYDPDTDGVIALAQLDSSVSTFKQANHNELPNPHHATTNDPTTDQKAALAGTSGTPGVENKFVTNADTRNSDARTPTSHSHSENILHSLATAVSDFLVSSGAGVYVKKTLAEVKTILGLGTAAYTAATDYVPHALATAANDFIVASGSGAFVKKTLAEILTILGKSAASGLASLDASSKVVQEPASKAQASGIAPLDAVSKVPTVNLGGTGASATNYLCGDQTWKTPAGGGTNALLDGTAHTDTTAGAVARGDVVTGQGATPKWVRLSKGTANQVLSMDATATDVQWKTPAGGSDPWVYLTLASDFTTTSATAVDVTGLGFAPVANTKYEFSGLLMLRTATATVNPRVGLAWPTGMTDGVAKIEEAQTAVAVPIVANGNINAVLLIAAGGLPNTTQSWPARVEGMAVAGATPSGNVRVQLASETAGTTVRIVAGSFLRYRSYT